VKNINLIAWQSIPNTTYSMVKITVPGYTMQNDIFPVISSFIRSTVTTRQPNSVY